MSASNLNVTPVLGISGDASYNRTKITDYVGNKIYENGSLKRILVDGGYIENNAYHYYLADHLGNNRIVAKADASIVQSTHYYPFGMAFADGVGQAAQPYKFSGKELDSELGLNIYDSQARQLTSGLPRFTSVDPHAENYYSWSPYAYCGNNPMKLIDPDGKDWRDFLNGVVDGAVNFVKAPIEAVKNIAENGITMEQATQMAKGVENAYMGSVVDVVWAAGDDIINGGNGYKTGEAVGALAAEYAVAKGGTSAASKAGNAGKVVSKTEGVAGKANNVAVETAKTVSQQAKDLSHKVGKNSVEIKTTDVKYHYDMQGAPHKGVNTPHVQRSLQNTSPKTGETFWNKDRKWVRPMEQQDLRTVRKYLDKK